MDPKLISYDLPPSVSKVLIDLVDIAKEYGVLDISYMHVSSREEGEIYQFRVRGVTGTIVTEAGSGDPIGSLRALGLIHIEEDRAFLTPTAFERAKYERRNRLLKKLTQAWSRWRDMATAIAFVLSVWLAILQVMELLGWKFTLLLP